MALLGRQETVSIIKEFPLHNGSLFADQQALVAINGRTEGQLMICV